MKTYTLDILGTPYTVTVCHRCEDPALSECGGYCSAPNRRIVVDDMVESNDLVELSEAAREAVVRQNLRHELIHAFLAESGLADNWKHPKYGHDETFIDWFAIQYPKLQAAFAACRADR